MNSRRTVNLDCVYFDTVTEDGVTATVEAWWAPSKRLAFIELNAWTKDSKARITPVIDVTKHGPRGEPVPLESVVRVLRSPTENEIGDVVRDMKREWYERVGRATGKIPPIVSPVKKTAR